MCSAVPGIWSRFLEWAECHSETPASVDGEGGKDVPKGSILHTSTSVKVLPDFYEKCWRTGNPYQKMKSGIDCFWKGGFKV